MLKTRGRQRADSTHVLAAIRTLNRLELIGETMRAALNELARVAPDWLQGVAPTTWYERYDRRIEDSRLPKEASKRSAYAQSVGADGFALLDALDDDQTPAGLRDLLVIDTLRRTRNRHYERQEPGAAIRFKADRELPKAAEALESPYDEARYRHKRDTQWTGYMVHVAETCEPTEPHLFTHVHTTSAAVHEARCTDDIGQALVVNALAPGELFVDSAYVSAELLVKSREAYGIALRGPTRPNLSWQRRTAGAYELDHFAVDRERRQVLCPQGKTSVTWSRTTVNGQPLIHARFTLKWLKEGCNFLSWNVCQPSLQEFDLSADYTPRHSVGLDELLQSLRGFHWTRLTRLPFLELCPC